jgi:hypothetical protein
MRTGPAFGEPRSLSDQLEASLYLVPMSKLVTEGELDQVHGELEALLLGAVQFVPMVEPRAGK